MPGGSFALLPGVIVPAELAARLADVCVHSDRTREAVVRQAVEAYVDGYITGTGLTVE